MGRVTRAEEEAGQTKEQAKGREIWALAGLSASMLLSSLGTSIANVALPSLTHAFAASFQQVQWVVLAYLLAITILIVSVGRLGDLIGRKRLLLAGLALFTFASLLCALAPSLYFLIAARALQGAGASVMMALTLAFVADIVPKERSGSAMGLLGTMSAVGTACGPSLGGLLLAGFGWESIFLLMLPLGALAFALALRFLPADMRVQNRQVRFDRLGTLLLGVTLGAYALAMTMGRGAFGLLNVMLLAGAGVSALLFLLVEGRTQAPLVQLTLFRRPALSTGLVTSLLMSSVVMATLVVGPFYLAQGLGLKAAMVGLVLSTGPVVAALTGVPAGRLVDRFGAQRLVIAGLALAMLGCGLLALTQLAFGVWGYVLPIMLVTFGYALFQTANNTSVMAAAEASTRGLVSGMLNLSRNLGLITGASLMGAVFAYASSASDIRLAAPQAVATGMQATFALAFLLMLVALGLSVRPRRSSDARPVSIDS